MLACTQELAKGPVTCGWGELHTQWSREEPQFSNTPPLPEYHDCQTQLFLLGLCFETLGSHDHGLTSGQLEGRASRGQGRPNCPHPRFLLALAHVLKGGNERLAQGLRGTCSSDEWMVAGRGCRQVSRAGLFGGEAHGQLCCLQSLQARLQGQIY